MDNIPNFLKDEIDITLYNLIEAQTRIESGILLINYLKENNEININFARYKSLLKKLQQNIILTVNEIYKFKDNM